MTLSVWLERTDARVGLHESTQQLAEEVLGRLREQTEWEAWRDAFWLRGSPPKKYSTWRLILGKAWQGGCWPCLYL